MQADLPAGLVLRRATDGDSDIVKALVWQVLREYGMEPDPAHADRGLDHIDSAFDGGGLWLLLEGDALIGTVGLSANSETVCELTKMFLTPSARGKGLGRALLVAALDEARARGYRTVELETDTSLKEAVQLYRRYGFEEVAQPNSVQRCNMVMHLTLQ
ncbi:GNAT family N-acetyltransferase [Aquisalinus flavus]|uniref:N-acetyltransferase n=1 Tax=Aquisalinus flavus TaxID=1526572 RepID=A0A8J2V5L5_9PROT|nr:GNAT family N-acetyltransferase [Aquisalinus flavus]MBD0427778.1 GNAT family N-acetyltransferase [Aquisalinus flavus]UNE47552.1 GNAT family N-acetyltransferase [Aquisalinus flavus]GGD03762.1 N-acetyltransferase [Aquisalinus flavus]